MHVRKIIREIRKVGRYLGNYGKFYSEGKTPFANGLICTRRTPFGVDNTYLKGGRHLEMAFYPIFSNRDAICKWRLAFTVEFARFSDRFELKRGIKELPESLLGLEFRAPWLKLQREIYYTTFGC
ncbi:hypothetical protein GQ457_12G022190 [Hibiscus cannabinus]